jgi:hypothetical protein
MTDYENDEYKSQELKKKTERTIARLIILGAISLLLIVIIIGIIIHNS